MNTLRERVAGLTKIVSDDALLTGWFEDAIADIVYRLSLINPQILNEFTQEDATTIDGTGFDLIAKKVLKLVLVTRNDYGALEVSALERNFLVNSDSLKYCSKYYPKFYKQDGKIYVLPAPISGEPAKISFIKKPDVVVGSYAIPNCPYSFQHIAVLFAAIANLQYRLTNQNLPSNFTLPTLPILASLNSVSGNLPTFTDPDDLVLPVAPATIAVPSFTYTNVGDVETVIVTFDDFDTAPVYTKPVMSLEDKPSITNLNISSTVPTAPSSPSFTYDDASATSVSATTIDALGDAPEFVPAVSEVDMSDFNIKATNDDVEIAAVLIQKQAQLLQKYQIDIQNNLNTFNKDVVEYQADMQHKIEQSRITLQEAMMNAKSTTDVAKQNAIQNFQKDVQEYAASVQKYSGEIQSYQISVNKEVQEWQANTQKDLANWQNYNNAKLQKYSQLTIIMLLM